MFIIVTSALSEKISKKVLLKFAGLKIIITFAVY